MSLEAELQKIYDSEINIRIGWMWDAGIEVALGDEVNGFVAAETVKSAADVLLWFQEAIAHFYPDSDYARTLPPELLERGRKRLFPPTRMPAPVKCPHCGARHQTPMDEVSAFVCRECGKGVELEAPPIQ